jgi:phospholipid/cholesterol/gamma-HCH transport system permease protein
VLEVSPVAYVIQTLHALELRDIWEGLSKSVVFAVIITLVGISTGFGVTGGAEGVGRATTRAVVLSITLLVVADMIFSFFLNR